MPLVRFGHIIGSAIKLALSVVTHKFTHCIQMNMSAAEWIARQPGFGNRYAIDRVPFLRTQIEDAELHPRKILATTGKQLFESAVFAERRKRRIGLGRIANSNLA